MMVEKAKAGMRRAALIVVRAAAVVAAAEVGAKA
jgi:hypothetical protein